MTRSLILSALCALTALVVTAGGSTAVIPVTPTPYNGATLQSATWEVLGPDAQRIGEADWRIVKGTGNCCENFVMASPDGTLYDWGGTHIMYSKDDGLTWFEVRPPAASPADNGEGAIAMAPDGDVLGVTWDPYQGDRLQSFKLDAQTNTWSYSEQPVHAPFYDRQWFTTVPGATAPGVPASDYLSVIRGAYPAKDIIQYSSDGLIYTGVGAKRVESLATAAISTPLPVQAYPEADWIQPHAETTIVPLGGGYAFGGAEFLLGGVSACDSARYLMTPDGAWHCYEGGQNVQWHVADSTATLHAAEWNPNGTMTHTWSTDGGQTVTRVPLRVPAGAGLVADLDIRVNGEQGIGVIAASTRDANRMGQHVVFVITRDDETGQWSHAQTLEVGDGDLNYGSGVGAGIRFDFATIALMPDGRMALSFNDNSRRTPAVAILQGVRLDEQ